MTSVSVSSCTERTSAGTGNWSSGSTWDVGVIPTQCSSVTIRPADVVTVDTNAQASTTTINGTLSFSRVSNSTLTIAGGNVNVNPGGTLNMGTSGSPIPSSLISILILSSGATAGQYGLIVQNGGNFLVYGSTKMPWVQVTGTASGTNVPMNATGLGWSVGDTVAVDSEVVTVSGLSGAALTVSGLGATHVNPVVAMLTHNVVVRSSGTDVSVSDAGNSAYIQNLAANTTSFNVNYGEFAYLGNGHSGADCLSTNYDCGISFDGQDAGYNVQGMISSSSIHGGWDGIYLTNAANNLLSANVLYGDYEGITLVGSSNNNTLLSNVAVNGADTGTGLTIDANSNLVVSNLSYWNDYGILIEGGINNVLIADSIYANVAYDAGLSAAYGSGNVCAACNLGYSATGVSLPDSNEVSPVAPVTLVFKNTLMNTTNGNILNYLNQQGSYWINYSTSPGVMQVYGDYTVSGSTLTLNYASQLYTSTATTPALILGAGGVHTSSVTTTYDANAVSQLIAITYVAGTGWVVTGSSTTGALCTITGPSGGTTDCPTGSSKQFNSDRQWRNTGQWRLLELCLDRGVERYQ